MRITESKLRQIIREEIMREQDFDGKKQLNVFTILKAAKQAKDENAAVEAQTYIKRHNLDQHDHDPSANLYVNVKGKVFAPLVPSDPKAGNWNHAFDVSPETLDILGV